MEWTDWVDWKPETKTDIKIKIENDGYTFPHYDLSPSEIRPFTIRNKMRG
ncbi:Uncharacterised protein [Streptococcus pneumoniae]|nr:Uncharacterised protein [Streptococcus pneumoniae]CJL21363.1 Uncharacterised protein [Streptococcus pneumoniae]CJL72281.1 Uncharacterised protein [Streptococcus pneumoniae]CJP71778.1 Uncharacterised protein [Streptococcus pneumoniae]CJX15691.1 Uncharacterised protein [Streptococcus pneumoniae]